MQSANSRLFTFSEVLGSLYRTAGFRRLWRGVSSVIVGCVPAHAAYFSIYEVSKKHFDIQINSEVYFMSTMVTGCFATLAHDFIMTPMDGDA
jgi:solute carrier family 25 iron transporter 28/37